MALKTVWPKVLKVLSLISTCHLAAIYQFFSNCHLKYWRLSAFNSQCRPNAYWTGTIVTLSATGGSGQYKWMPSVGLGTPNEATTTAIPLATTTYTVQSIVSWCGLLEKEVTIFIQACSPETDPVVGTVSLNGDGPSPAILSPPPIARFYKPKMPLPFTCTITNDFNAPGFTLYDSNLLRKFCQRRQLSVQYYPIYYGHSRRLAIQWLPRFSRPMYFN